MANRTEAYDLSRFEQRYGTAVPQMEPQKKQKEKRAPRENIVEIPSKELEKNRRRKIHPFRALTTSIAFVLVLGTVLTLVYNQVRLTELTDQINIQTTELAQAEALAVELEMRATEKVQSSDVEAYAREQLGMSKITEGQVVYVNMVSEDKGTVVLQCEESFLDQIIQKIKSLFA